MGFTSHQTEVLEMMKHCKRELAEKIGVLCVAETQPLVPVLTGNLKRSVTHEVMQGDVGVNVGVTADAPYGIIIEKGSTKYAARPYLEPGCMNAIPKIKEVAESIYRSKLGGS